MKDFTYVSRYLYSALRWRLFVWLALIVLASALEGVTIGLLLPIVVGSDSNAPLQGLFTTIFVSIGIEYTVAFALGAMMALYALRTALVVVQEVYVARVIADLMVGIKSRVFDGLLRSDYQYFTRRGVGYFNNAVTVEFTNLTNAFDYCNANDGGGGLHPDVRCAGVGHQPCALAGSHHIWRSGVLHPQGCLQGRAAYLRQEHGEQLSSTISPDPDPCRVQVFQGNGRN